MPVITTPTSDPNRIVLPPPTPTGGGSTGGSGGSGGSSLAGGYVFITGVTSGGNIFDKVYVPDTVPANTVIASCATDNDTVTVEFIAEGWQTYSPTILVGGIQCTNLTQFSNDRRLFTGTVTLSVTESRVIVVASNSGRSASISVTRLATAPVPLTCVIGILPGTQTEVKLNDTVSVTGTVQPNATHVRVMAYGAFKESAWIPVNVVSPSLSSYTIPAIVNSSTGLLKARVEAKNIYGTIGAYLTSSTSITLNQTFPTFGSFSYTCSSGNLGFKGTETGTFSMSVANADTYVYSSPNGNFIINSPTVYSAQNKVITCTNPSTYIDNTGNVSSNSVCNIQLVATKLSNGAQATFRTVIEVAPIAPVVSITLPQSRLRSSFNGEVYSITATSTQNLPNAPNIIIPTGFGSWQNGSSWSQISSKVWKRNIVITDSNTKGSSNWGGSVTNLAGVSGTITGTLVNGGFVARDIILPLSQNEITVDVAVTTFSKLQVNYWEVSGQGVVIHRGVLNEFAAYGMLPTDQYFTVNAVNVRPHTFRMLNLTSTTNSSQSTMIYGYEEIV